MLSRRKFAGIYWEGRLHKRHFSPEINPTWAGYRNQKGNGANKSIFPFLTFLEGEVGRERETGFDGEFLAHR